MSLDMSRLLDIIGGQVQSEDSSNVPFRDAFFDMAFVTLIGFASHPLKTPDNTTGSNNNATEDGGACAPEGALRPKRRTSLRKSASTL
jgi:hypothetical protein